MLVAFLVDYKCVARGRADTACVSGSVCLRQLIGNLQQQHGHHQPTCIFRMPRRSSCRCCPGQLASVLELPAKSCARKPTSMPPQKCLPCPAMITCGRAIWGEQQGTPCTKTTAGIDKDSFPWMHETCAHHSDVSSCVEGFQGLRLTCMAAYHLPSTWPLQLQIIKMMQFYMGRII